MPSPLSANGVPPALNSHGCVRSWMFSLELVSLWSTPKVMVRKMMSAWTLPSGVPQGPVQRSSALLRKNAGEQGHSVGGNGDFINSEIRGSNPSVPPNLTSSDVTFFGHFELCFHTRKYKCRFSHFRYPSCVKIAISSFGASEWPVSAHFQIRISGNRRNRQNGHLVRFFRPLKSLDKIDPSVPIFGTRSRGRFDDFIKIFEPSDQKSQRSYFACVLDRIWSSQTDQEDHLMATPGTWSGFALFWTKVPINFMWISRRNLTRRREKVF